MNSTVTVNEVLYPVYLLMLGCFISPVLGEVASLYVSSSISIGASILMIYISIIAMTSGSLGVGEFQLLTGISSAFSEVFRVSSYGFEVGVDGLSAFFIFVLGIVSLASSIYGVSYIKRYVGLESLRFYSVLYPLFLMSMYLLIICSDVILFIISWELMSITAFFLIAFEKANKVAVKAALKYLLMSYFGSSLLIIALVIISSISGSTSFTALRTVVFEPTVHYLIMALIIVGFGIKAALVPMHSWLPDAYPEALSNISALLSGFMSKTAVYGVIRFTFILLGLNHYALGLMLSSLGIASAIYGTLMAIIQVDSKKLMAYSSIAQIGYIFLGIGGGLTLYPNYLGFIALAAGLFHTLNHAIFKGLLFLTAGSLIYRTGSRDLNSLGGLAKVMPITYTSGLIGSLAISGMPPLNGFVSKRLILIPLLISGHPMLVLYAALAIFASALTTAAFVKYLARAFLSSPKNMSVGNVKEVPLPMALAMILLASLCVVLGLFFYIPFSMASSAVANMITYVSYTIITLQDLTPVLYVFALLTLGIFTSAFIAVYLTASRKFRLTPVWTFGTKDLLPKTLGLNAHSYYREFGSTYSFVYVLRSYVYELVVRPLCKWSTKLARSYYDFVDIYLPTTLAAIVIKPLWRWFIGLGRSYYDWVETYLPTVLAVITALLLVLIIASYLGCVV
ncbi:MAG: proton-conducting transporter membrane subunit [Sulfolobales archaeon]